MLQATYTQGNWGDSRLLMVKSQIVNLTFGPSFGHNLCFRCPNGSCEPISDIFVPRAFQWYKKNFNPMSFYPCNRLIKIQQSIGTLTPKMGNHLGVWGFFPHALLHSREHEMWLSGLILARTFANPCLGCKPKVRVATIEVPMDSQIFREQLQGSKTIRLKCSLYHWKVLEMYMFKMGSHDPFRYLNTSYGQKKGRESNW
jgi:hypothetical protein